MPRVWQPRVLHSCCNIWLCIMKIQLVQIKQLDLCLCNPTKTTEGCTRGQTANSTELHIWDITKALFSRRKKKNLQSPSVQRLTSPFFTSLRNSVKPCASSRQSAAWRAEEDRHCLHQLLPAHLQGREMGLWLSTCM